MNRSKPAFLKQKFAAALLAALLTLAFCLTAPAAVFAAPAEATQPVARNASGEWAIYSGQQLHDAMDQASATDTFVLMNDIVMGEAVGLHPGLDALADGIATELGINQSNIDYTFKSGAGSEVTIYRVDHRKHMIVAGAGSTSRISNITLRFSGVVLNGLQSYVVENAVTGVLSQSSRGGLVGMYTNGLSVYGAKIINCFSEVQNIATGANAAANQLALGSYYFNQNGGGFSGWYCDNTLFENCTFSGNVAGSLGGGLSLELSSGTLRNTIITNNASRRPSDSGRGGGVYVSVASSFTIEGCTFSGNTAEGHSLNSFSGQTWPTTSSMPDYGGGLYAQGGSVTIADSTFSDNQANFGGGILVVSATVTLKNLSVTNNRAINDHPDVGASSTYSYNNALGGGLWIQNSTVTTEGTLTISGNETKAAFRTARGGGAFFTLSNVTLGGTVVVDGNSASAPATNNAYGGGLYFEATTQSLAAESGLSVTNNLATLGGGAFVNATQTGEVRFTGSLFSGNRADTAEGLGGAIYTTRYGFLYCDGVRFSGNTAGYGGFYMDSGDDEYADTLAIYQSNITNTASLSAPFSLAAGDVAYNNYDIDYIGNVRAVVYNVYFHSQGGGRVEPYLNVSAGSAIAEPAEPSAPPAPGGGSYIFGGWYREPEALTRWDFLSDTVDSDITLYAKWTLQSATPPTGDGALVYLWLALAAGALAALWPLALRRAARR